MPPTEIELKLHLPDDAAALLAQRPIVQSAGARILKLDNIYLDTADRLLQKNSIALRLRRVGRKWVQTVKTAGEAHAGLSRRSEWEVPAAMRQGKPHVKLQSLAETPLPALLAERGGSKALIPVFRARFTRELRTLRFASSVIELAIDRGRIDTPHARPQRVDPISEIELELKDGRTEDVTALALRLVGRGRHALALVPLPHSKAERGYRLADDEHPAPAKAAARGFVAALEPGDSAGQALRAIMAHGLSVLLANTDAMRSHGDVEYVHQARVALRRMRSALRLLDRRHDDFPQALADELRWAGRLLGASRDWDVLTGQTLPTLATAAGIDDATLAPLLVNAHAKRDAARAGAVAGAASPRYAQLALRLQSWMLTPAPKGPSLEKVAARKLDRARRRLLEAARFFAALSPERRHQVRIKAKRLRYALDVMSVALPNAAAERYSETVADLQDVLGELNDIAVAETKLSALAARQPIATMLLEWSRRREQKLLVDAEVRMLALSESNVPWK